MEPGPEFSPQTPWLFSVGVDDLMNSFGSTRPSPTAYVGAISAERQKLKPRWAERPRFRFSPDHHQLRVRVFDFFLLNTCIFRDGSDPTAAINHDFGEFGFNARNRRSFSCLRLRTTVSLKKTSLKQTSENLWSSVILEWFLPNLVDISSGLNRTVASAPPSA